MRLPLVQLQAVIIMMLFGINLAAFLGLFPSNEDMLEEALNTVKKYIDTQLEPYINLQTGYLPLMPVLTLRSVLVNFIHVEKNESDLMETSRIFHFNGDICTGFRSLETASQLLQHLKQLRPFNEPPYTELTGSILMEIFSKLTTTKDDIDNRLKGNGTRIFSYHPCITQWRYYMDMKRSSEHYEVTWKNLVRYPLAEWYQYQEKPLMEKETRPLRAKAPNKLFCYEVALLGTAYEKIKLIYRKDVEKKKIVQTSRDKFLTYLNVNKTSGMLFAYTIHFGIHHNLLRQTGNDQLQAEIVSDSSHVKPQVDLFHLFLYELGLMPTILDQQALKFLFNQADFTRPEIDSTIPGWTYFEMLQQPNNLLKSPFISIFEGFKEYQDDKSLVSHAVFKSHQMIHFLVSYGNMFKLKDLKMATTTTILPKPVSKSPTLPPPPAAPIQPKESGKGSHPLGFWDKAKACWGLPKWCQIVGGIISIILLSVGVGIGARALAWRWLLRRNTDDHHLVTFNTTTLPPSDLPQAFNWTSYIMYIVIVVISALVFYALWWHYWIYQTETVTDSDVTAVSTVTKKKKKVKKVKRNKALKVNRQQPTSMVSSAASTAFRSTLTGNSPSPIKRRRRRKTPAASPKWSPPGKARKATPASPKRKLPALHKNQHKVRPTKRKKVAKS